ncbi:PHD/FYVE-zinc-finger like domain-containing protein [Apiospora kogelbergensis]|uniref:PHD/FYVE-zinc-finger like domain-containing protein n=1 Tax=Apiospora kogelbergensis TaxID=1337665 RepID=A0AAW0QZV9_9PEZI
MCDFDQYSTSQPPRVGFNGISNWKRVAKLQLGLHASISYRMIPQSADRSLSTAGLRFCRLRRMLADLGRTVTTEDSLGDNGMNNFVFDMSDVGAIEADPMDIDAAAALNQHILDDVNAGLQAPTADSVVDSGSSPNHHAIALQDPENDEFVAGVLSNNEEVEKRPSADSASDVEDDAGDMEDQEESEDVGSQLPEGTKPRLFPIEVVLSPPADPDSYRILPPSMTVEKVIREVEQDGGVWYEVEFDDGRADILSRPHAYCTFGAFRYLTFPLPINSRCAVD